jgi:tripartite-type tricarboxylate transporter receptor subunit TctC
MPTGDKAMKRHAALAAIAAGLLGAMVGAPIMVQDDYPTRRVTLVVPSPAGSTTDALARLVAEQLQQKWGSPVIVENNSRGLNAAPSRRRAPRPTATRCWSARLCL